jgi:ribosomal protein L29
MRFPSPSHFPCVFVQHCKLLQDKLTKEFAKNFEKFELYASRNIFVYPDDDMGVDLNGSAGSAIAKLVDEELEETKALTAELTQLRRRYLGLTSEGRELEQLLADMKSSLFGLRVGAQVFEQLSAQQLTEAVAEISDYKRVLLEHVSKANGMCMIIFM